MTRLNGWQRLWLASAVLYAGVIVAMIYLVDIDPQHAADVSRAQHTLHLLDHYDGTREATLNLDERQALALAKAKVRRFLREGQGPLSNAYDTFVDNINSSLEIPVDFSAAYLEYDRVLKEHRSARLKVLGYGFLGWAGPVAILYLLGVVIAWIHRGFQGRP
jgi:hypothetical protein